MNARLSSLRASLRYSFWFLPALMTTVAALLAPALLAVDARVDSTAARVFMPLEPEGIRQLLVMVASTMITVATTAFSIVIVALQLASGQLGPRLLRNFIRDRGNQAAFGTFIGTFVYCLLVLRVLNHEVPPEEVPYIALGGALLLTFAGVAVLVFFIHHAARSIQKDRVIARVSSELNGSIGKLYPKTIGFEPRVEADRQGGTYQSLPTMWLASEWPDATDILMAAPGYVQALDATRLMKLAVAHDLCVYVRKRPGDFVPTDSVVARVRPAERVTPRVRRALCDVFSMGSERTAEQDVAFVFDQLVEIALRALSPAANDSFTAIRCIDRLGDGLAIVARTTFPSPYRVDVTGTLRVITHPINFDVLIAQTFYPIAAMAADNTIVMRRLLQATQTIAVQCDHEAERASIRRFNTYLMQTLDTVEIPQTVRSELQSLSAAIEESIAVG